MAKTNTAAHTKWMCKYHIVFTPKYRRKIIFNQDREDLRDIIKQLCAYKGVEILEEHIMPDHDCVIVLAGRLARLRPLPCPVYSDHTSFFALFSCLAINGRKRKLLRQLRNESD